MLPRANGLTAGCEQMSFPIDERRDQLRLVASPDGDAGLLTIRQDTRICFSSLAEGEAIRYEFGQDRHGWLQVLCRSVRLNDHVLQTGDGAALSTEPQIGVAATSDAEILLFNLA